MIPKRAYFYWGSPTMCFLRCLSPITFKFHNPGWDVFLIWDRSTIEPNWETGERQDNLGFPTRFWFETIKMSGVKVIDPKVLGWCMEPPMTAVHTKDLLNWHLLSSLGGLVSDMDVLYTAPISKVVGDNRFDVGLTCYSGSPLRGYFPVALMMSSPANPFFDKVFSDALGNYNPKVYQSAGADNLKYDGLEGIQNAWPGLRVRRLPDSIIFPLYFLPPADTIRSLFSRDTRDKFDPNNVGVHWYGNNPEAQRYSALLNEDNLKNYPDNTIAILAQQELDNLKTGGG